MSHYCARPAALPLDVAPPRHLLHLGPCRRRGRCRYCALLLPLPALLLLHATAQWCPLVAPPCLAPPRTRGSSQAPLCSIAQVPLCVAVVPAPVHARPPSLALPLPSLALSCALFPCSSTHHRWPTSWGSACTHESLGSTLDQWLHSAAFPRRSTSVLHHRGRAHRRPNATVAPAWAAVPYPSTCRA